MWAVVFATINQEALLVMVYRSEVDNFSLENYFLCTVLLVYPHSETCTVTVDLFARLKLAAVMALS